MTRPGSDKLGQATSSNMAVRLIADVFYGPERVYESLPIADNWQLKWDLEADVKASGTVLVQYTGALADSLTPYEFSDMLAPFGAELNLLVEITVGKIFTETTLLGRFVISKVPDARDETMRVKLLDRDITVGSVVELTLADPLSRIRRWGFPVEQQPESSSAWGELQRITGFQITRNVPDATIPDGLLYEPKKGGRLDAVQTLAGYLGGRAYMTPDNTLSIMPYDWDENDPVMELRIGTDGTVLDAKHSMDSEEVYNEVIGVFENNEGGNRSSLYKVAEVQSGPLDVNGPYGRNTYYHSSSGSYTDESAQAETDAKLASLLASNTYRVPVTAITDPRVFMGDVVTVQRPNRLLTGRVMSQSLSGNGLMQLENEVRKVIPR